jgi:hypothetical protein
MSAIGWFILIFDIAFAIDAARRPASAWAAADRRKGYWVGLLAVVGFVAFIPYVIGVLPGLMQIGRTANGTSFQKRPTSLFEKSSL